MRSLQALLVLAVLLCSVAALAATGDRDVTIFKGGALAQDGIAVGNWGSGKAAESSEKVLAGTKSIKITTQGMYAGGRIDFAQPVPLFTDGIDPKRYVVFSFFFDAVDIVNPAAGTLYSYDIEPYTIPKARLVRFMLTSDKGATVAIEEPTRPLDPDDNWVRVAVPLAKLKLPEGTKEFRMSRVVICSDIPTAMYLGEIKIVTDDAPIKVDPLGSQTLAIYDEVLLAANATAGYSALKYSWDFDKGNGIQVEATGKVGRYVYTRGGDFTATLTVSDVDGLKQPVTLESMTSVND